MKGQAARHRSTDSAEHGAGYSTATKSPVTSVATLALWITLGSRGRRRGAGLLIVPSDEQVHRV
jgi:hypothetical protein